MTHFNENMSRIEKVRQLYEVETEKDINYKAEKVTEVKGDIRFQDCVFSYDNKVVLEDVSFHISPGERVAIAGKSGTGKSTILSLILGLYPLEEGNIYIDGYQIREMDLYSLRKNISVVSQEIFILDDTIRNNLLVVKQSASEEEIRNVLSISSLNKFVDSLPEGLDTVLEKNGSNLSGGQKQRLAIARALLKSAKILLLDEATSALDANTESEVKESLHQLKDDTTIVIVSHRYHTIAECDKVIVLKDGSIEEIGKPEELMECKGALYKMFYAEAGIG